MSPQYLLDTNICIYIAKQKPIQVFEKFKVLKVGQVVMSVITYGELIYGAYKSDARKKTIRLLHELIELIPVDCFSCFIIPFEFGDQQCKRV